MYYTIITPQGREHTVESASTTLTALKAEYAAETFGVITLGGKFLLGIDLIKQSIITLAPSPPNEEEPAP